MEARQLPFMKGSLTQELRLRRRRERLQIALATDYARSSGELVHSGTGFKTSEDTPDLIKEVAFPTVNWSTHRRVTVRADLSGIINGRRLLVSPTVRDALEVHGPIRKNSLLEGHADRATVRRWGAEINIPRGIFLGGFGPFAYYHHLCERISRLSFMSDLPEKYRTFPILAPSRAISIESLVAATRLLAPSQKIISIERKKEYLVGELVWVDEIHRWTSGYPGAVTSREGMERFRREILSALNIVPQRRPGVRLYIVRGPLRRSVNEDALLREARRLGFTAWHPQQHSFAEQVRTWSSAEVVVGDGGAAWSGCLFAAEGSKGLVVTDHSAAAWPHFGCISGMDVRMLRLHFPEPGTENGKGENGFFADPGEFRGALEEAILN
jgi:hypothetical protein